ncbi:uncharacterized protein H6S33_004115 [Morchella sextelata]|uniref:uncharacterized protein n=1 Tax=Morchella sextelata TaxID=1174677 RepID=UPI001D0505CB|nr:uncharacterized protein H6S33_004115 [Morchella sextelata]KAH0606454.1 hypothetical protein H6S33_004115 [Morchella sextelata]
MSTAAVIDKLQRKGIGELEGLNSRPYSRFHLCLDAFHKDGFDAFFYPRKQGKTNTLDDVAANRTAGQGLPPAPQNLLEPIISSIPEHADTEIDPSTRVNDQEPKQEQKSCSNNTASISPRESTTGYSCQPQAVGKQGEIYTEERGFIPLELSPEEVKIQISPTENIACPIESRSPQETATEHQSPADKVLPPALEDSITRTSTIGYLDHHPGHISPGNLATNGLIENYPQKQHPEPLAAVSTPQISGEDLIRSHSKPAPYLNKENKAMDLSQRLEEFKLETGFQGDYVLQRAGTWESGSSTKLWRTSRWKKKAVIGSGNFGTFDHLFVNFDGWYEDSDNMFLVMEYVRDGDLSKYIQRSKEGSKGSRSLMEVKEITRQILEGLEVLHSKKIYHRDLKPQNILMASLDPVWIKIADFGASKHAKNTSLRTRAGTQGYLAPEILGCNPKKFKTQGLIPHALDVWSLGCLVYELIAFEPPFLDQEPDEEDEPATGVEAWPTSEPREFDFACLREYCDSGLEFPAALLKQSDLPVGEEEEAFIRSLSVPSPMARPTAANSLQGPWLRGLYYTSGRIEFWKNEFLQLGVQLDFGKENILMRQVDVRDIYQFLPKGAKGAKGSVSDLLMVAARKSRKEALERLLKSPSCLESIGSVNRVKLFQQAIETGQRDMVQRLLQHKAFAEASFGDKSVQGWAVEVAGDDGEMVKVILEHASDLCGALLLAVKSGDVDIVRTVLGRDPEKEVFDTGDSLHTPLREAVKEGYLDIVKLLLNEDTNINFPAPYDAGRRTLLQTAAAHGHVEIVKYLLDKGVNVNGLAERDGGRTALQAASELGHVEIINLLLKNGANVNSPAAYTNGRTALQAAVEREHLDAIKILLDSGANVNGSAGAEGGKTALQADARCGNLEIMACTGGHFGIVKLLLNEGADIDSRAGRYGRTALQAAAEVGDMETFKLLMEHKADVNATAGGGESAHKRSTALQLAAGNGYFEMVKILIDNNAHVNAAAFDPAPFREYNLTALQAAAKGGHLRIVKLLLENEASTGGRGWTPLSIAAGGGYMDIIRLLLEYEDDFKTNGTTALNAASGNGRIDVVKLLLDRYNGAHVNARAGPLATDQYSPSPSALEAAAGGGYIDVIKLLLDRGAGVYTNPVVEPRRKPTPNAVEVAAGGGHIGVVELLLDGSTGGTEDVKAGTVDTWTRALTAASKAGHSNILEFLLNHTIGINSYTHQWTRNEDATAAFRKALGFCIKRGHIEMVELILHVYKNDEICVGALQKAARVGNIGIVKLLLSTRAGAAMSVGADCSTSFTTNQGNLNHLMPRQRRQLLVDVQFTRLGGYKFTPLQAVCKGGHNRIVKLLLENGPIEQRYQKEQIALCLAAMEGHTGIVKLLLSSRADVNGGGQMETNWTIKPDAPQLAALYGHIHIVKLLPDHGIDPSNLRDNKCTPLPLSAFKGHTAIVKLLLDNISVRFPDKILGGNEALLVAAVRGGNLNTIRLSLKNKVNVNIPDSKSVTALHAAAEIGHISILKLLINNKADVNAETEDGTTVLKRAFISQNIDAIKLLVNLKANDLPITNNHYHYRDEIRDEYSNASGRGL